MDPKDNLLLAALSTGSRELLMVRSVAVELPLRTPLFAAQQMPGYAHFLTSGVASLVVMTRSGGTAEVGLIGREGVVGGFHALGPAPAPTDCMMQMAGAALRIPLRDLRDAVNASEEIRRRILEMAQEETASLSQIAGCNRLHEAEPRLARWLLMAMDRTGCDVLNFTQEFLANMLGAQRTTVTVIAGELQRRGVIQYSRGKVRILDRAGLEAAACDCYPVLKELYANLYKRDAPGRM